MTFRRRTTFPGLDPRANKELIGLQDDLLTEQRQLREESIGRTSELIQSGVKAAQMNVRIPCLPVAAGVDLVFPAATVQTQNRWIEVLKLGGGDVRIRATGGNVQGVSLVTLTVSGFYYYQSDGQSGWWTQPSGGGGGLTPPVALTDLQNISANSWLGNNTGAPGPILELNQAQMKTYIGAFGAATTGLVPASGGGTTNFLRADGAFAAPGGGGGTSDAYAKLIASMRG